MVCSLIWRVQKDPPYPTDFAPAAKGRPTLPISEMVSKGDRARALAFRVRLPVRAVIVRLERANAQTDLPLLRTQLDDLHLVVVAHLQIDLLAAVRVIELRHMNQPLDALIELDEGAEVGHARDLPFDGVADVVA